MSQVACSFGTSLDQVFLQSWWTVSRDSLMFAEMRFKGISSCSVHHSEGIDKPHSQKAVSLIIQPHNGLLMAAGTLTSSHSLYKRLQI